ncbi:MAG: citramalate synthase [Myxococcales bacterium]|nr:citramalate synthase [Myxococcales bacterium]
MTQLPPDFVEIYDTTLRDGTQREGLTLSLADKIRIAKRLDAFGVSYIEGGWPGSNPKDVGFFEQARDIDWKHAAIAAFGSTRRAGIHAEDDVQLKKLIESGAPVCTLFGKTWTLHVTEILRTTLETNLEMIRDSIGFVVSEKRRAIYDAEHFFDGYKADPDYAIETLRVAHAAGAEVLVLCDTNGGSMPWEVDEIVRAVRAALPDARLGVHPHDDGGCGVANALAAVRAGATHVQGTINGYGERCGNANLCTIIPDVELKLNKRCLPEGKLAELYELSHFVAEVANLPANEHAPYVGRSAFAHKGGVHVAAIRRVADSYQHVDPELVGNECRVVVSELSGRGNVQSKAEELGLAVSASESARIVERIKQREAEGFAYEAAEASFSLLVAREAEGYVAPFQVLDYQATVGRRNGSDAFVEATIRVVANGEESHTAGSGNGPVSALDRALRKALLPHFPEVARFHLVDYKVRILDGQNGTASTTRVLIDMQAGEHTWSVVGASSNIIEASLIALVDGIEYGLRVDELSAPPKTQEKAEATAE